MYDVASLRERDAVAGTLEAEIILNASTGSGQIVRDTAELRKAHDVISMQSNGLAMIAQ